MEKNQSTFIPVKAILLTRAFSIPDSLEFGFCPTAETSSRVVTVHNSGELPLSFQWKIAQPFELFPKQPLAVIGFLQMVTLPLVPNKAPAVPDLILPSGEHPRGAASAGSPFVF